MRNLHRKLDRAEEELSRLIDDIQMITETLPSSVDLPMGETRRRPKEHGRTLDKLAEQGVTDVRIEHGADRTAIVRLDAYPPLRLTPRLAALLVVLHDDNGPSNDDLVCFKSRDDVAARLGDHPCAAKPENRDRTVTNLVYRLRRAFDKCGCNPRLIQTNAHGYRLAVRRKKTDSA
jgi:hypothetical protein